MIHSDDASVHQLKLSSNQSSVKDCLRHSLGNTTTAKHTSYFGKTKPFEELSPGAGYDKKKSLNNSTNSIKGRKIAQPVLRVMTNLKLQQNASNILSFSSSGGEGKYDINKLVLEMSSFNHSTQTKSMLKKVIESQTRKQAANSSMTRPSKSKRSGNNSMDLKKRVNISDPGYSSSGRVNSPYRKVQQAMAKKQQQVLKGKVPNLNTSVHGRPPTGKPRLQKQSKSSTMKSPQTLNSEIKTVSFGGTQKMHNDFDKENQDVNSNSPQTKVITGMLDLSVSSVGYSEQKLNQNQVQTSLMGLKASRQRNEPMAPLSPSFDKNKEEVDMFENHNNRYEEEYPHQFTPQNISESAYQNIRAETEMDVFNMLKGIGDSGIPREHHHIESGQTKSTKEFQETGKFINPLEVELAMNNTACKFGYEYPQTLQVDIQNETPSRGKTQKINTSTKNQYSNIQQTSAARGQQFAQQMKRKFKRNSYSLYISNKTPTMMSTNPKTQKVDKLVKDNIKKLSQQKEIEEFNKILVEEDKIMKRKELQNHNNQVRMFNAQKVQQRKKGRSVSCMNKFAPATSPMNFRHSLHTPHNIQAPSTLDQSVLAPQGSNKNSSMIEYQRKKDSQIRRKSFVLEFREIKREIEKELKKEMRDKRTGDRDTIDSLRRKEMSPLRPKKLTLNRAKRTLSNQDSLTLSSKKISIKKIKQAPQQDVSMNLMLQKKPRLASGVKKESIRKFMNDQKKKIMKKKTLEKSSEIDKTKKIKGNLRKLHKFIKTQINKSSSRRSPERPTSNGAPSRVSSRGVNAAGKRAESAKGYTQMQKMKQKKFGRSNVTGSAFIDDPQRQAQIIKEVRTGQIYQGSPDISDIETQQVNDLIARRDLYHDTSNEELDPAQNLTEMSTEFYVEYFKILNNIQKGGSGSMEPIKQKVSKKKKKSKTSSSMPGSTKNMKNYHLRQSSVGGQEKVQSDDEDDDEMQFFLQQFHANVVLIQRHFRDYLMRKGFYNQPRVPLHQHYYDEDQIESDEMLEDGEEEQESQLNGDDYGDEGIDFYEHQEQPAQTHHQKPPLGQVIISKDASKVSSSYRSKEPTVRTNPQPIKAEEEFEFDDDQFNHNLEQQKVKQIENAMGIVQASDRVGHGNKQNEVFEYQQQPRSASGTERKVQQAVNPESLMAEESKEHSGRISQNSQIVPSLNLSKLQDSKPIQPKISTGQRSSQRDSIFDRNSFQDFKDQQKKVDFIDMLRMRENLMVQEVETKKKKIAQNMQQNLISPRTAQYKQLELEKWASQEKEEIKKIRVSYQEQWDKTRQMIEQMPGEQAYIKHLMEDGAALKSQRSNIMTSRGGSQVGTARGVSNQMPQYEHQSVIQMISGKPSLRSREEDDETVRKGEKVYIQDEDEYVVESQRRDDDQQDSVEQEEDVITVDIDSNRMKDEFMIRGEINLQGDYGEEEEEYEEEEEDDDQFQGQTVVNTAQQSPEKVEYIQEEEFFSQTQEQELQFQNLQKKYGINNQDDAIQAMAGRPLRESPNKEQDDTIENASSTDARVLNSQSEFSADMMDLRQRTYSDEGGLPKQPSHPIEYVEVIGEQEIENSEYKDNVQDSQQPSVREYELDDQSQHIDLNIDQEEQESQQEESEKYVDDFSPELPLESEDGNNPFTQTDEDGDQSPTALSRQIRTHKQLPVLRVSGESQPQTEGQERPSRGEKVTSERSSMEGKILESNPLLEGSGLMRQGGGQANLPTKDNLIADTSQPSLASPYHQENFFTKGFDERPMEDVIDEIKSSTQGPNNIAQIIKEIQEEGEDGEIDPEDQPFFIGEEDEGRFSEKNRTFNNTAGSNYIKVVEEEEDGKPSEEDEEVHQRLSIDEHYDEPPQTSAKTSPQLNQNQSNDYLRQMSHEEDMEVRTSQENSEFEWHQISMDKPIQESLESMEEEVEISPADVTTHAPTGLEKAPPTSPLSQPKDQESRSRMDQKSNQKMRFDEGEGHVISLSSGENLDDFYEQDPKPSHNNRYQEEAKTSIITGSQSLESTLSEEGKLKLASAVKIVNDPINLELGGQTMPNIPNLPSPSNSDGLPTVPQDKEEIDSSGEFQVEGDSTMPSSSLNQTANTTAVNTSTSQKVIQDKDGLVDWITDSILHQLQFEVVSNLKGGNDFSFDKSRIDTDEGEISALIDNDLLTDLLKNVKTPPQLPPEGFMEEKKEEAKQAEDKSPTPSQEHSKAPLFILFENDGIRTDLIGIAKFVEETYQRVKESKYKEDFLDSLLTPVRKNPLEILNQLQNSEIGSYEHFEAENLVVIQNPVIPLELYLEIEKERKAGREEDQVAEKPVARSDSHEDIPDNRVGRRKFEHIKKNLNESEHIHNKALFDCINETLCQFRPYSKEGEPQPWSRKQRKLKTNRIRSDELDIERIFELVKHDLFQWAIMQSGTLPRKEFIFGGIFDDELFAEIREKKLATLLATEVLENEPQWLNYEFEEAQVKIDLGDMILEHLVTEVISISNAIQERRQEGGNYESVWRNRPANLLPAVVIYPTDRTGMFDTDESYDISSFDGGR